ncbi:uncharacterized protein PV06_05533 [Exophiala oligosperma]|uniref:Uncharacterized protein n=1 Tax=Exophiala oligosperma TaxID=215243 RepID=A0A0D2APS7_9EURO|nr:uncharacterized protein PV06_05533 [Exophiala oligosperma]KIW41936.1 hypothetical protein PV06_05533 [Exophiala oligosperma]
MNNQKPNSSLMIPWTRTEKAQARATTNSDETYAPIGRHPRTPSNDAVVYYSTAAALLIAPLIATIIWLSTNHNNWGKDHWSFVHSATIGGRLTQPGAKAIDVLCSAFLAPLILAGFNAVWFSCARVATINEKDTSAQGVPLACLVEVSSTTGGSYDILKLSTLLGPRTRRLICLSLLVIFSALAKSAFGNVIAYEAFNEDAAGQDTTLRMLSDAQLAVPSSFVSTTFAGMWGFNTQQRSSFANQFSGMLTGLSISNSTPLLTDDKAYLLNNVTTASLALPSTVQALHAVPASRWSVSCKPFAPDTFMVQQMGEKSVQFTMTRGETDLLSGNYPGDIALMQNAYNEDYPFMAFPYNGTSAFLGYAGSFNLSNETYSSPYGDIVPKAFNMTASGFNGTKQIMSVWGMECQIHRQNGTVELLRSANGDWKRSLASVNMSEEKTLYQPLRMQQLQLNLNYQAPDVTIPGLAPALARSADPCYDATITGTECTASPTGTDGTSGTTSRTTDYETLALNFLYASAETERMAYEVASTNSTRDQPDFFIDVADTSQILRYRITYVPVILFVGIACMFVAAGITLALVAMSWSSTSGRSFRQVNGLRLLVDVLAGLKQDEVVSRPQFSTTLEGTSLQNDDDESKTRYEDLKTSSDAELQTWASGCRVRYIEGSGGVGLERLPAPS